MIKAKDTFFGQSTPPGRSATATIRISGPKAFQTIEVLSKRKKHKRSFVPKKCYLLPLYSKNNSLIDTCVVLFFKAPKSYTGDDVVEIHSHGNPIIINLFFQELIDLGLRVAEPGEFTRSAYLNNKIDLVQAEAILSLINSKSKDGLKLSHNNANGSLTIKINQLKKTLVSTLAMLEYELDVSDTDNQKKTAKQSLEVLVKTSKEIDKLISSTKNSRVRTEGPRVVIFGKPNVGKSTLFNSILNYKRSIVTTSPGTTRDSIEEDVNIKNHIITLIDTAGIRSTKNLIEKEGIRRSKEQISSADIKVRVLTSPSLVKNKSEITAVNKIDLLKKDKVKKLEKEYPNNIFISAKKETGINRLLFKIDEKINNILKRGRSQHTTSVRQEQVLNSIKNNIKTIVKSKEVDLEILAYNTKDSISKLDTLLGKTTPDEVLDSIFSNFCVGK